jgi:hypothetical protein
MPPSCPPTVRDGDRDAGNGRRGRTVRARRGRPRLTGDSQEVAAQDAVDGIVGVSAGREGGRERRERLRREEADRPLTDLDVVRADEFDRVVEVADQRVQADVVGSEEDPDAGDADDPAGGGAGPGLFVGDGPFVVPHRPHAGVAVDHRPRGDLAEILARTDAAVRAVGDHAQPVHLPYQRASVRGEALVVGVHASRSGGVAVVVGGRRRPYAQPVIALHQLQPAAPRARVLRVERHGRPPGRVCRGHVAGRSGEQETVVRDELPTERLQDRRRRPRVVRRVTDVDRDERRPDLPRPREVAHVGRGQQRKAAVLVPQQR